MVRVIVVTEVATSYYLFIIYFYLNKVQTKIEYNAPNN